MQAEVIATGEIVDVPDMGYRRLAGIQGSIQAAQAASWSNPQPYKPERCLMHLGEIDTFYEQRGYGFIECQEGRIFFHVSGYRHPRLLDNDKYSPPKPEIQLVDLHLKAPQEKKQAGIKPDRIPVPPLPKKTAVLFEIGKRNCKQLASIWCLRDVLVPLQHELESKYDEAMIKWQREAVYRLTLHKRVRGQFRADNDTKRMVQDCTVHVTPLFEGTNTNFLQSWFRDCRDSYTLNADCWMELHYREWNELDYAHGEWMQCPAEMMHDFLG